MSWLDSLRQQPHQKKVKLIWITITIVAIVLCTLWIFTSHIGDDSPKNLNLFQTFGDGIHNIKEQYRHN